MTKTIKLAASNAFQAIREDYEDTRQCHGSLDWKFRSTTRLGVEEYARLCFFLGMSQGLEGAMRRMKAEFSKVGVKL